VRRPRLTGLRARLLVITLAGSLFAVGALLAAFNLVLDGTLRGQVDNRLRDRATAQLQTVQVVDGKLRVTEAPDKAARDVQTWIFAARQPLEQPPGAPTEQRAARSLIDGGRRFVTVSPSDTRLYAVPIVQSSRRLGTLVVGASLSPYESSASAALIGSLILGALTVLGIGAISAWVIHRALAPVARMTQTAAEWGEHDLSRRFFAGEPHDELTELAATFDRLLERLAQSLEREQRFTAEISHELRTPLAKIIAEAELACTRERTPERYRKALESIRLAAESLGGALEALLASARAGATGAGRCSDARMAVEHATRDASAAAASLGIALVLAGPDAGVRVAAEPELIERSLAPVIDNALRFARRRVEIAFRGEAGKVVFEVRDDGPGVAPTLREQIFEPGVSLGANGSSGAGLGLSLARRLARAAGGELDCVAGAGEGATFALRLPCG
jgi:two-component system, OmpR family, sensor kinase